MTLALTSSALGHVRTLPVPACLICSDVLACVRPVQVPVASTPAWKPARTAVSTLRLSLCPLRTPCRFYPLRFGRRKLLALE